MFKKGQDLEVRVGRQCRNESITLSRIMRMQRRLADDNTLVDPRPFSPIR